MHHHSFFLMVLCAAAALLPRASQLDEKKLTEFTNSIGMKFVLIPPGEFTMGSPESERHRRHAEQQHSVRITKAFYLGVCEVTQGHYRRVMGKNPSYCSSEGEWNNRVAGQDTSRFPVEGVSWEDAVEFCRRLSKQEGMTYRLPTEAEWEYACRAGSTTAYGFGEDESQLGQYAWYRANINHKTNRVGTKRPNSWGLYDMHGNVWEWCQDWYDREYYRVSPRDDPPGPRGGAFRVIRGGGWDYPAGFCRSALHGWCKPSLRRPNLGFRVVLVPSGK